MLELAVPLIIWRRVIRDSLLVWDRFYILATKERVSIPVHLSAEMVPFSHHVGELRVRCSK